MTFLFVCAGGDVIVIDSRNDISCILPIEIRPPKLAFLKEDGKTQFILSYILENTNTLT